MREERSSHDRGNHGLCQHMNGAAGSAKVCRLATPPCHCEVDVPRPLVPAEGFAVRHCLATRRSVGETACLDQWPETLCKGERLTPLVQVALRWTGALAGVVSAFAEPSSWRVGAVLNVAWCAVCVSAAPNSWRIEDVLVVAGVV